ncbi:MAG: phosphate/phosphite/phosphonate ABC transporter substrate-binding protein [bacterium]
MFQRITPLSLLLVMLVSLGCSQDNNYNETFQIPENKQNNARFTIKFGRVPSVTVTELLRQNAPLIKHLKQEMNVNITYRFADDYRGIIEGMDRGDYDFAWLGPYSYVLSNCFSDTSAAYRPLVRPVRHDSQGKTSDQYRGIIFTRAGSSINTVSDLRGKSLAFVDRQSTSGFLFPMALIIKSGLNPSSDINYEFLHRHDQVVNEVKRGNYAAGAVYENARLEEYRSIQKANRQLPVLARTSPIPTSPIVVSPEFSERHPDLVEKFTTIMTTLQQTAKGRDILSGLDSARYKKALDSDYDAVKRVLKTVPPEFTASKYSCQGNPQG